ncbi:hypothetical protein [Candidatus Nitrospira allomarina]|uniref:Uncharacterized protein n=1 Tax=Candidatus Nitrospira allomarina TaxID=3020900 RepID=A0AA96GDK0_9BACT|nr:hypothetical protein [Candidatus Nitrospira allomarina]WNM59342.1 hypothetical protein PP769_06140 [Candidatus Nitrospira allomarina]
MGTQTGLRLEQRGDGNYYKVILHIGSTLIPISDDIVEELRTQTALPPDQFFAFFLNKVGYSSYLQEQLRREVRNTGDLNPQISAIQEFFRQG